MNSSGVVKPGWKTSEFWGKVFIQALILFSMSGSVELSPEVAEQYGLQLIAGLEGAYIAGRNIVKSMSTKGGDP